MESQIIRKSAEFVAFALASGAGYFTPPSTVVQRRQLHENITAGGVRMADREQDSLFREIEEDLRHEQFAKLWKKYGNYVIGAALLLVIGVAGFQAWRAYDLDRRAERSALFANALRAVNDDKLGEANAMFAKLAEGGPGGYAALARLNQAAIKARSGDSAGAAADYVAISQDKDVDADLRNLALILSVLHEADQGDPTALSARIRPLTAAGSPWRHSAKELDALLAQRMGDKQRAIQMFRELADDATAPAGVRARAAEMSAILGG